MDHFTLLHGQQSHILSTLIFNINLFQIFYEMEQIRISKQLQEYRESFYIKTDWDDDEKEEKPAGAIALFKGW
jgi:hypothetical protein